MIHAILLGIDGSDRSRRIVAVGAELARATGASVHLLCVVDPAYYLEEGPNGLPDTHDEIDYPAAAIEREGADQLVRQAVADLQQQGTQATGEVLPGEPATVILEKAATLKSSLIVMGHRHLSWIERHTSGSVCHKVLEHALTPVVVVPSTDQEQHSREGE
ncbi:universal stress protein [Acetobacteraceae bacterium KSS8]|uniref:Universal stress protein n=1 Tax=Endosaccharibacter trunci TaxID=2812733 RepID=A0ABT1WC20_9PROT|nr:universal stress protein [Acetobacteraceae bacterium KSS8]